MTCVVFQFPMCLLYTNTAIKPHQHTKTTRRNTSIKVYSAFERVAAAPSNASIKQCISIQPASSQFPISLSNTDTTTTATKRRPAATTGGATTEVDLQ